MLISWTAFCYFRGPRFDKIDGPSFDIFMDQLLKTPQREEDVECVGISKIDAFFLWFLFHHFFIDFPALPTFAFSGRQMAAGGDSHPQWRTNTKPEQRQRWNASAAASPLGGKSHGAPWGPVTFPIERGRGGAAAAVTFDFL